ncbi:MAG: magnesium transporter MgtE [Actinobacteria bacterium HGW-Actinobacteria-9]|jgi:Mg2+ transporter MgtE|nr:MAG: magnesium transporter MgtE [Actinobacteria bacterium HGW-Actinobacteria-9]
MFYLSQMLGRPVVDATGADIGTISDIAIATGEVFPRVTSLAFRGPDKTPFMLSWRKFVAHFDGDAVTLNVPAKDIRFSYLQPDEVLLHRDLLNKQIVDTQGMKVVRVNDLKLSDSRNQLRLLGAEVGVRGILRSVHPMVERTVERIARIARRQLPENLIAWNYMELLDRDMSHVKLSVTHKRLHELHPADVADILEKLSAAQRAKVFEHLDNTQAADAISALEDEYQADVIDDLGTQRASDILEMMDPDDAADVIGDLPYDKAEALLRLMGVQESVAIRSLLGYREKTAGGIMTPEVTRVTEDMSVQDVIDFLRGEAAEHETIYYIYVVDGARLEGVVSLRDLIVAEPGTSIADIVKRDVITVAPDDDQEAVAETMSKYDLLAVPVVDETGKLIGIVTVDDALDVLEEESAEDLALATGRRAGRRISGLWDWVSRDGWLFVWAAIALAFAAAARAAGSETTLGAFVVAASIPTLVVLRVAEDVASHIMSRIIESTEGDTTVPLWRRLLFDGASGLGLGLLVSLLAFGAWEFIFIGTGNGPRAMLAWVFAIAIPVITTMGTLLGAFFERRARETDRLPSQLTISLTLMLIGAGVTMALLGVFATVFVDAA